LLQELTAPLLLGSAAEHRKDDEIGNGVKTTEDMAMAACLHSLATLH
jgi:hypothetical protein